MDRRIKSLKQITSWFIDRDIDGVLIIATDAMSSVFIVHSVDDTIAQSPVDVAIIRSTCFTTADALVSDTVAEIRRQLTAIAAHTGELEDVDTDALATLVAPLPAVVDDLTLAPLDRLSALMAEVHRRLSGDDRRVVWCFCPVEIADAEGYGRLLEGLVAAPRPSGARLVLRDDLAAPLLDPSGVAASDESIVTTSFSISVDEIQEASARRAADPSLPPEIRLPALLEAAYLDLGHGHLDVAEVKFSAVLGEERCPRDLSPLACSGLAEIARRRDDQVRARHLLERALAGLNRESAAPVVHGVVEALGQVAMKLGDAALAEDCFVGAAVLALRLGSLERHSDALVSLGEARLSLGKIDDACTAWEVAADQREELGQEQEGRALRAKVRRLRPSPPQHREPHED